MTVESTIVFREDMLCTHRAERRNRTLLDDSALRFSVHTDVTPDAAVAAVEDVLASMGDVCPECPPDAN
jgi:hypothetical protein